MFATQVVVGWCGPRLEAVRCTVSGTCCCPNTKSVAGQGPKNVSFALLDVWRTSHVAFSICLHSSFQFQTGGSVAHVAVVGNDIIDTV
jgi:hypothetical protein